MGRAFSLLGCGKNRARFPSLMIRMVKIDDNKKPKVICIICKSKPCLGRCRYETAVRWTPQPPKTA
jgi:hypothetical protein